jgi:hypothetical protein
VIHGVERDAALKTSGLVAEARGHPGMSTLVKAERKQQKNKLEYSNKKAGIYQTNSPLALTTQGSMGCVRVS